MASPASPSTRAIAKVFFTVAALAALLYVLYLARSTVLLVFIAVFLAAALGPAVDFFDHRARLPRALAILLVYVLLFAGVFGVGALIVPPIVSQVQALSRNAPAYLEQLRANDDLRGYDERYGITEKLTEQARALPERLAGAAGALQAVTVGVFGAVVQLVTVLTIIFFLLLDGNRLVGFGFRLLGPRREPRWRAVAGDVYRATSGYVAGNLIISIIAGTITYATLTLLDVPFAVPLAVLMSFLDLIPLVGATIAGLVILAVTLIADFPTATIVWAVVFLLYQQLENNVLQPIVYKRTVDVAPLVVIVAVLMGGTLLGVLGALLAIPVAATIQILLRDTMRLREQRLVAEHVVGAGPPHDEPLGTAPA